MESAEFKGVVDTAGQALQSGMRKIERREWGMWASAVLVTLVLTLGLVSFVFPMLHPMQPESGRYDVMHAIRGLVGLVLLFDLYLIYQQLQIYRMRRRLVEREELFRLITENAADMIAVVDAGGERVYNSPSYEKIMGFSPQELKTKSPLEQIHPDDRLLVTEAAAEAQRTGQGRRIEYRMQHRDGTWRTLESTASAILNERGAVDKLVVVNRDISDRRRLEEQFRQAQKMEAVGRLSGGIAHDFNNLLGVIIGYSEILQEHLGPGNDMRISVDEILKAGRTAASLTRQLLAFSRQQVLEPRVLSLNAVTTETEKMLRRMIGEDVQLITVLDPQLGRVKADQGQIEQVILNLAVNARDAMPQGGKLLIQTRNVAMDEEAVRRYSYPFKPGRYVLLTVTDTGMGMDAATEARIFEPFFTTKEKGKGTGLGLATVYGVVKQSDGYIEVQSELGTGTTFKIHLPRVDEPVEADIIHPPAAPVSAARETILLVEDEVSLRNLTRNVLRQLGYTVLEAASGTEALAVSQQHHAPIDLVLTDVVMPGMGGCAMAAELGRTRPGIRVLYISGYTGQAVGHGVLPAGSHFLAKPFSRDSLSRKIREVLESQPAVSAT
jgi:PAS domain S-box-containing protein